MKFPTTFPLHPRRRRVATPGRRTLARVLPRLAAAGLVAFHGFLLWDRIASLTLFDPAVALRWGAAATLALGLARLWRAGAPLLSSREALVLWSLVALLHAGMVPGLGGLTAALAEADAGLWLVLSLAGLLLLGARADAARVPPAPGAPALTEPPQPPAFRALCLAPLAPRPPPAA